MCTFKKFIMAMIKMYKYICIHFQTESMLKIAEDLGGPVWGSMTYWSCRHLSYGGMENPCLTFVTPTLLVV